MPYARQTPEQIAFAKSKQQEYNKRYRQSAKGREAHRVSEKLRRAVHPELQDARRAPCGVCGGPKEPGRGFRKCNTCWGIRRQKDLAELIAEQHSEMYLDKIGLVPPQRFGDSSDPNRIVYPIDWRDEMRFLIGSEDEQDVWSDPTYDEAIKNLGSE